MARVSSSDFLQELSNLSLSLILTRTMWFGRNLIPMRLVSRDSASLLSIRDMLLGAIRKN